MKKRMSNGRKPKHNPTHHRRLAAAIARPFARFWAKDDGVSAVEFAIVFPMFLAVFMATFSFGIFYATQSLMDNAARDVARQIRIGTINGNATNYPGILTTTVCNDLTVSGVNLIPSCTSNIQIYLAAASSGTPLASAPSVNGPAGNGFNQLTPATVSNGTMTQTKAYVFSKYDVLLQIGYQIPWAAAWFHGSAMLMSSIAFQTEPY